MRVSNVCVCVYVSFRSCLLQLSKQTVATMSSLEPHLEQLLNPIERLRLCAATNLLVCWGPGGCNAWQIVIHSRPVFGIFFVYLDSMVTWGSLLFGAAHQRTGSRQRGRHLWCFKPNEEPCPLLAYATVPGDL